MFLSMLEKREEFLEILDQIKRDIESLPLDLRKNYSNWENKLRCTFLALFRKAVELGDAVTDLYMSVAFSKYDQTQQEPLPPFPSEETNQDFP